MPLAAHEVCELSELLTSCLNSINSMGLFINSVKDAELKGIIQKHMAAHVQDYNMKAEWVSKMASNDQLNVPAMPTATPITSTPQVQPVQPNPNTTALDDRSIAVSYLLTLKRAGREYAWAAFETTDPQLRKFLEDCFTMCSRHSYEVWGWLTKKGYYPLEPASQTLLQKVSQTFQLVPEKQLAGVH
jgi:spore coat protein CotF